MQMVVERPRCVARNVARNVAHDMVLQAAPQGR